MAELVQTAANVVRVSGGRNREFPAGTTVVAGNCVYLAANNTWLLAQCDGTGIEAGDGTTLGVAEHAALAAQPLSVQTGGVMNIGATLTVGAIYVPGTTPGAIQLFTDLVSTNKITVLGIGATAANLDMSFKGAYGASGYTGLAKP